MAVEGLRPRGLADLLDAGISMYRGHFLHFLGIAAVSQIPLGLVSVVVAALFFSGRAPNPADLFLEPGGIRPEVIAGFAVGLVLLSVTSFLAESFSLAAMICSVEQRVTGRRPSVRQSFAETVGRIPALLGARLLYLLISVLIYLPVVAVFVLAGISFVGNDVAVGVVLLLVGLALLLGAVVLSVLLGIRWVLHAQAVVVEGQSPLRSLYRSSFLVRDRWWFTLGFVVVLSIFVSILSALPGMPVQLFVFIASSSRGEPGLTAQLLSNTVSTLTQVFVYPIQVIMMTLLYIDYRVRKEGLDLERAVTELYQEPR